MVNRWRNNTPPFLFFLIILIAQIYSSEGKKWSSGYDNSVELSNIPKRFSLPHFISKDNKPLKGEFFSVTRNDDCISVTQTIRCISTIPRGGCCCLFRSYFAGWNPFGYGLTQLGKEYLENFNGSLDSDVGRFLATFKSGRKTKSTLKDQWLEILRVSKKAQSLRIYKDLDKLMDFCVKSGFLF